MKILWITNSPIVKDHMTMAGLKGSISGGWIEKALEALRVLPDNKIAVASVSPNVNKLEKSEIKNVTYYLIPGKTAVYYQKGLEKYWLSVNKDFAPDVIHIHGSEFPIGLSYIKACGAGKCVLSVQGLIHQIALYHNAGISKTERLKALTIFDILHGRFSPLTDIAFKTRSKHEIELIKRINHVIGRTGWDKAHVLSMNPKISYYNHRELIREAFYVASWKYESCIPHSIFVSQAYVPIKGLHWLLRALDIVKRKYPDVVCYVAGSDIINQPWHKIRSYGRICKNLIRRYDLSLNVKFIGPLNAMQMKEQLLQANAYLLCSAIENSPNSLCEAQIVGTPAIASMVGGVIDFVDNNHSGFIYRAEDYALLAKLIIDIFDAKNEIESVSTNEREIARKRHKVDGYSDDLIEIYKHVSE